MLVRSLFEVLNETIDEIAKHLPPKPQEEKIWIEKVRALRKMSDEILDHWVEFEERFDEKLRPYFASWIGASVIGGEGDGSSGTDSGMGSDDWIDQKEASQVQPPQTHVPSKEEPERPWFDPERRDQFRKAKGYFELGMYQKSLELFNEIIAGEPEQPIPRLYLAYSAFFTGEIEEAKRQFHFLQRTEKAEKIHLLCSNALGMIAFHEESPEMAEQHFRKALQIRKDFLEAQYNLGVVLFSMGRYSEAIQVWEEYLAGRGSFDLELAIHLSSAFLRLGKYEKAIQVWKTGHFKEKKRFIYMLGEFFERMEQFGAAFSCYREIARLSPKEAEAYHGMGWNLWLLGDKGEEAVPLLKKAISLGGDPLNIGFSLAWILMHEGELEMAEKIAQGLSLRYPDSPLPAALSSTLALMREDREKAALYANRLREMDGEKSKALGDYFYGKIELSRDFLAEAIAAFQSSIRRNPLLRESRLLQGLAYYLSGELKKAEESWQFAENEM